VGDARLIQITPQLRILVAIEAIDGRKGIDWLAQLCRENAACRIMPRRRFSNAVNRLPRKIDAA
jgi:hypothetical protein